MADEYIRREDAIEEIDKWLDAVGTALVGKGMSYYGELIGCIEDTPAADVAPVVHGKWVHSRYDRSSEQFDVVKCSRCGLEAYAMAYHVRDGNYCPRCGARMDGGNEDDP